MSSRRAQQVEHRKDSPRFFCIGKRIPRALTFGKSARFGRRKNSDRRDSALIAPTYWFRVMGLCVCNGRVCRMQMASAGFSESRSPWLRALLALRWPWVVEETSA